MIDDLSKENSSRIKIIAKPIEYKHRSHRTICFGEFCEYKIPSSFKNLKTNPKIEDSSYLYTIPEENKFTNKNKEGVLPFFLPVFSIKKAYDNPQLVNIVLKAFSIFPKDFDKEEEIAKILQEKKEIEEKQKLKEKEIEFKSIAKHSEESMSENLSNNSSEQELQTSGKNTVTLYTPTPGKFTHMNYDEMYIEKNICENCFKIYSLINDFLSHIGRNAAHFESFSKVKELLLRGDNLKANAYEDNNNLNFENNLLFHEEAQELSLKKLLKRNLLKKRDAIQKQKNKEKVKLVRKNRTRKEDMDKVFSYDIKINPKLLKLNLVAEKTHNKFFKLIFNELRAEPESLYQKLGIQKPESTKPISMPILRMHMGINSHIYKPKTNKKEETDKTDSMCEDITSKRTIEVKEEQNNIQRENNQIDMDIFLLYKSLKRDEQGIRVNRIAKTIKVLSDGDFIDSEQDDSEFYSLQNNNYLEQMNPPSNQNNSSENEFSLPNDNEILDNGNINKKHPIHHNNKQIHVRFSNPTLTSLGYLNNPNYLTSRGQENKSSRFLNEYNFEVMFPEKNMYSDRKRRDSAFMLKSKLTLDTKEDINKNNIKNNYNIEEHFIKKTRTKNIKINKVKTKFSQLNGKNRLSSQRLFYRNDKRSLSLINPKPISIENYSEQFKIGVEDVKERKLKEFIRISPKKEIPETNNSCSSSSEDDDNFSNVKGGKDLIKKEKRIQITSVYYDKNIEKNNVPYYFITTPLPKFNEGNIPIIDNPLLLTQQIQPEQYIKLGKFKESSFIKKAKIFIYDSNTAVPYEILNFCMKKKTNQNHSNIPTQESTMTNEKQMKFIFLVINDFFDSYGKYKSLMCNTFYQYSSSFLELKCVLFNLPGQAATMWSKNSIFNNMYYSQFIDRFLYFLYNHHQFDQSYNVVFVGFGNGAQIALTYASKYEKYWDCLHSIVMFNGYCENDSFIDQSMFEILKTIQKSKNPKAVEFFMKSITIDPQSITNNNNNINKKHKINKHQRLNTESSCNSNSLSDSMLYNNMIFKTNTFATSVMQDDDNPMTLAGYHNITKGYFFNMKINYKSIQTTIICIHSNQDSFISINNINALFNNRITSYGITLPKTIGRNGKHKTNTKTKALNSKNKMQYILPSLTIDNSFIKTTPKTSRNLVSARTYNTENNRLTEHEKEKEYDFSMLLSGNMDTLRKLIIIEGSHDIMNMNSNDVKKVIKSYMKFIINNKMYISQN